MVVCNTQLSTTSTRCLRLKQPLIATSTLLDKVSLGLVLLVRSGYVILKSFKVCPSVYLYMSVHHASAFHHMNNFSLVGTLWWACDPGYWDVRQCLRMARG